MAFGSRVAASDNRCEESIIAFDYRFCPEDRLETIIRVFNNLRSTGRPMRLVVIRSESATSVESLGINLGIGGDISLTDAPSAPEFFNQFDVFISLAAGFPNAILQAMLAGCAVLASAEGKCPSVSPDAQIAGLVTPNNAAGLQRALADLIDNKSKRRALAAKAQHTVSQKYSPTMLWRDYDGSSVREYSYGFPRGALKTALYLCVPRRLLVLRSGANRPEFALTFDDGPDPHYTPKILEILREHGAPATFFVVGNCAEQEKDLVERIAADGHEIGNHSYTHPYFHRLSWAEARREFSASTRILREQGHTTTIFRPPFGKLALRSVLSAWRHGYRVVMASIDLKDFHAKHSSEIQARLEQTRLSAGDIVLYHGTCAAAISALPHVLQSGLDRGLKPVQVSELLR